MNKEDRKKLLDHIGRIQHKIVDAAVHIIDVVDAGLNAPAQGRRAPATVAHRQIANMLRVSQFCANRTCRRSHCRRGEPPHCLQTVVPLLPEQAFDGLLRRRRPAPARLAGKRDSLPPMPDRANLSHPQAIAAEVLAAYAAHAPLLPFSSRPGGLAPETAARVTPLLRAAFEARGEKILGRKIGFTNRTIWAQYGVDAPNWGYITSATVHDLAAMPVLRARDFSEPRIEPEIMFGLKAAPAPEMDDDALSVCIDWLALGYEVVQSPYPDWKFKPADTVAANALHGALMIGERHAFAPRAAAWRRELASFTAQLFCNDALIDSGGGAAVLDSPLKALRHLVAMLAGDPHNPPLAANEIVTTGTLTKAFPVHARETWRTTVAGIPLAGVTLQFN